MMRDVARDIALFMITNSKDVGAVKTFTQFLENCIGSERLGSPFNKQWRAVVSEYVRRISNLDDRVLQRDEWQQLGAVLEALEKAGYRGTLEPAGDCFYRARDYHRVTRCWEQCGATRKHEYYLAKAEVLGLPEGLEWLAKLPNADDCILDEWEKAGALAGVTDQRWMEQVGPALERKGQYRDALHVYIQLGDNKRVLSSFAQVSKTLSSSDLWEELVSLVHYLIQQELWANILDVLDRYFPQVIGRDVEKVRLQSDIVREFAYSDMPLKSLTRDDRQRYEKLLQQLLSMPDWQQHLSAQEVGAILEQLGTFNNILPFYERFFSASNPELRQFARERWVATKREQEEYYRNRSQRGRARRVRPEDMEERANQVRDQLTKRASDWGIRIEDVDPFPLVLERKRYVGVRGLPLGTKVEEFDDGSVRFQVAHIEVRTVRPKKRVLLTDTESLTTLLLDLEQGTVSGQADVTEAPEDDHLSFEVRASGYSGRMFYSAEKPHLELNIQGMPDTISLEL